MVRWASGPYSLPSAFMKSYWVSTSQKMTRGMPCSLVTAPWESRRPRAGMSTAGRRRPPSRRFVPPRDGQSPQQVVAERRRAAADDARELRRQAGAGELCECLLAAVPGAAAGFGVAVRPAERDREDELAADG